MGCNCSTVYTVSVTASLLVGQPEWEPGTALGPLPPAEG